MSIIKILSTLCLCVFISSCANSNMPKKEDFKLQGEKYQNLSESKVFNVQKSQYLGAKAIPLPQNNGLLEMQVTLRKKGTLNAIASTIGMLTGMSVHIALAEPESRSVANSLPMGLPSGLPPLANFEPLPQSADKNLELNYQGTLRGLLDKIAVLSNYGWDYDAKNNSILFASMMVRTFTLLGAPGKVIYESQITNKSKDANDSSSSGISGMNATASQSTNSMQTAQTNSTEYIFDIWEDTEKVVKSLLSQKGSVIGNQAAGTLTVRDKPVNIRQVATLIDDINKRLGRQVALRVQVWSLEINDDSEAGIDLQALFTNANMAITAGASNLAAIGGINTASVTILDGQLKNSSGVLKALKQWGNARQITSGGGLVLSNQVMPVQATESHAYLAGSSISESEFGQTTEITPGEVTTGFSMTVIPHILDKRQVILQYNISLSSLDAMQEFKTADITVQLPQVSTRAFAQRTRMQMGQTLVLAGFQNELQGMDKSLGLLSAGRSANYGKMLLVITIEVESANVADIEV